MRAKAFFRPAFICGNRGGGSFFICFLLSMLHVGRLSVFLWHDGEWTDRDRNPGVFRQLMFQYGTVKNILCFISEQKREKFFVHRSPYSVCIAPVTIPFPP
jgi:hypothetical protein